MWQDNSLFLLDVRLGQFYLLEVLLRLLVAHANMATQRQESPVGRQKWVLTPAPPGYAIPSARPALYSDSDPIVPDSLQRLARHLQVVVSLGLREALEVHQTGMQFLVVVSELQRQTRRDYSTDASAFSPRTFQTDVIVTRMLLLMQKSAISWDTADSSDILQPHNSTETACRANTNPVPTERLQIF